MELENLWNVGYQLHTTADRPRRLRCILLPWTLQINKATEDANTHSFTVIRATEYYGILHCISVRRHTKRLRDTDTQHNYDDNVNYVHVGKEDIKLT
jgi:hypothetical protein